MLQRAVRYLQYGQFCFLVCCSWCLLIDPAALVDRGGLSFYGSFQTALLPYLIGLGATAACLWHAAYLLKTAHGAFVRHIRIVLWISACCLFGILVTPSFLSSPMHAIHSLFVIVLFSSQLWLGRKLAMSRYGLRTEHFVFVIQLLACAVMALSVRYASMEYLMVPAQVIAGITASVLITRTLTVSARKQPEVLAPVTVIEEDILTKEPSGSS